MHIKSIYRLIAIVFLVTVLCVQSQCDETVQKPEFYAILIGINEYDDNEFEDLNGSIADSNSIRDLLIHNGVSKDHIVVMQSNNADMLPTMTSIYATLKSTLEKWKTQADSDDWLLFFYSGHGIQADRGDYLVPMDAQKDLLGFFAIPTAEIEQSLRTNWGGKQFLCFFDMCRSIVDINKLLNKLQYSTPTYEPVDKVDKNEKKNSSVYRGSPDRASSDQKKLSWTVIKSCIPSASASDAGFLAQAFVSAMDEGKLDMGSFKDYISAQIKKTSKGAQRPTIEFSTPDSPDELVFPICKTLKIDTDPQGAIVKIQSKSNGLSQWKKVGVTPYIIRRSLESCEKTKVNILIQSPGYRGVKILNAPLLDDPNGALPEIILKHSEPIPNKSVTNCIDDSEMLWVTSGPVKSETTKGKKKTIISSEVEGFWISKYEITEKQFLTFLTETGTKDARCGLPWGDTKNSDKLPAVRVTYELAQAYCKWADGRLPTEAEWMRAARGDQDWIYPWGNDWNDDACNYKGRELATVGFYPFPSPFGCYDMAGNVMEIVTGRTTTKDKDYLYKGGFCDCNKFKEETKATYSKQPDKIDTVQWAGFRVVKTNDP